MQCTKYTFWCTGRFVPHRLDPPKIVSKMWWVGCGPSGTLVGCNWGRHWVHRVTIGLAIGLPLGDHWIFAISCQESRFGISIPRGIEMESRWNRDSLRKILKNPQIGLGLGLGLGLG